MKDPGGARACFSSIAILASALSAGVRRRVIQTGRGRVLADRLVFAASDGAGPARSRQQRPIGPMLAMIVSPCDMIRGGTLLCEFGTEGVRDPGWR
jgi:hypothetical protein